MEVKERAPKIRCNKEKKCIKKTEKERNHKRMILIITLMVPAKKMADPKKREGEMW